MLRILLTICFLLWVYLQCIAQVPIEWQKCLGGTNDDNSTGIRQTKDSGFVVVGSTISNNGDVTINNGFVDYWITKLDKGGMLQWQKALGGSASDVAYSIEQTADGGYIACGYSYSTNGDVTGNHGYSDFWLVRLDATGNLLWQKCLGGSGHDNASSVLQTADGNFIVAGNASSTDGDVAGNHGSTDGWVVKINAAGGIVWKRCYGGSGVDDIRSIVATPDGGYIMTGYTLSNDGDIPLQKGKGDLWVIKIDGQGNPQWQKTYGGTELESGYSTSVTADGGYVIAAMANSTNGDVTGHNGDTDAWLVKLNGTGDLQWQKCFGGSKFDVAINVFPVSGGFMIGGQSASSDGDLTQNRGFRDAWILKISATGTINWQKSYGGSRSDLLSELIPTNDGWFAASASTLSLDGDVMGLHGMSHDYWVVKFGLDPRCNPSIAITASQQDICAGDTVVFSAISQNATGSKNYQWQINGNNVGGNTVTYRSTTLSNGDNVRCILTTNEPVCPTAPKVVSNQERITVKARPLIIFPSTEILVKSGQQIMLLPTVTGAVSSFTWTPSASLVNAQALTPLTIPLTTATTYKLQAVGIGGCTSNGEVLVKIQSKTYVPSAFTPNNDGKNDIFKISGNSFTRLRHFTIFDRWGQQVFTTTDPAKGWDGTFQRAALSSGVFIYIIEGKDDSGEFVLKGIVTLIR